jgi:general secretion pathway protein C
MNFRDLFQQAGDLTRGGSGTPPRWAARTLDLAPVGLALLLVLALTYYMARLIWMLYPAGSAGDWTPPAANMETPGNTAPVATDYSSISAAHLFGKLSATPAELTGDALQNAPDTSLNLQLRGAVAAGDSPFSHAIIADGAGSEKVYFVNDQLPGGAVLQKVEPDRVIINRGGVAEVLRLPRLSGEGGTTPVMSTPRAIPAVTPSNVQEMVQQNAGTFLDVIRPQPYMPNGQLKGYRIYPGPQRQQFSALGLRPGDLVTEINGTALTNPAQGMEVFRGLGNTTQMTVTVERDGQPQVLTLNLSQMNTLSGAAQ